MEESLDRRAYAANDNYPEGTHFEWDSKSGSNRAFLAHFPADFITRRIRVYGRVLRILPCPSNQGSVSRVLVVFGLKFTWFNRVDKRSEESWARAISWGSHFRQNPLSAIWSNNPPSFLVSTGQAVCGILQRAPGGAAAFSEWWLADELSWYTSQSTTFWESDRFSLEASEWGILPTLGGEHIERSSFPLPELRAFISPPNLRYQSRGNAAPCRSENESEGAPAHSARRAPPPAAGPSSILPLFSLVYQENPEENAGPQLSTTDLPDAPESRATASVAHY